MALVFAAKIPGVIEDKTAELAVWTNELKKIVNKGVMTYAFFNNHCAGFAPGSVQLFERLWDKGQLLRTKQFDLTRLSRTAYLLIDSLRSFSILGGAPWEPTATK